MSRKNGAEWKPVKPYPTFPLSPHRRGWCKKIRGRVVVICGRLPWKEALEVWYEKMPKLYAKTETVEQPEQANLPQVEAVASPIPAVLPPPAVPPTPPSLSVDELKAKFLEQKEQEMRSGIITRRTYMSIVEVITRFGNGVTGPVSQLAPDDFARYRNQLAAKYKPYSLDRHITVIRSVFNWAAKNEVIPALPRWGSSFEKPTLAQKRKYRRETINRHGHRMFTPHQVRLLLKHAKPTMKAMIYLAINAGLGNSDIAELPLGALDLDRAIIDYPRAKNGNDRRAALWPETVAAIRKILPHRPIPVDPAHNNLVFLTKTGLPWVRSTLVEKDGKVVGIRKVDHVTLYFRELMKKAGVSGRGLSFYALRRSYRTLVDATNDHPAINLSMGHTQVGIGNQIYVQRIDDARLRKIADYVRSQVLNRSAADSSPRRKAG